MRRSPLETMVDILEALESGERRVGDLVTRCNVSPSRLYGLMSGMSGRGLVSVGSFSYGRAGRVAPIYRITEKGKRVYYAAAQLLRDVGESP